MIITRLLPALLVAPVERDIRIINVVNPFYAAAARSFFPSLAVPHEKSSVFLKEGQRSLRMVVLTRHLQRVLDALPSAPVPPTSEGTSAVPVVNPKLQRSNIVAIAVSPGISRSDTIAPLLDADQSIFSKNSTFGMILFVSSLNTPLYATEPSADTPSFNLASDYRQNHRPPRFKLFSMLSSSQHRLNSE
jgi:hypothetical protein